MSNVKLYHPSDMPVTDDTAPIIAASVYALASPATDTMMDNKYRTLIDSLSQVCAVNRGHLQTLSHRVRLAGAHDADTLEIDFGSGIIGRYPQRNQTPAVSAKIEGIIAEIAKATGRVRTE